MEDCNALGEHKSKVKIFGNILRTSARAFAA
jgi:hypothetical protein